MLDVDSWDVLISLSLSCVQMVGDALGTAARVESCCHRVDALEETVVRVCLTGGCDCLNCWLLCNNVILTV